MHKDCITGSDTNHGMDHSTYDMAVVSEPRKIYISNGESEHELLVD